MTVRRITTVVGISSFCLGMWLGRQFREYNVYKMPRFKIFDAVNADNIVTNDQLITNNEQRISQVRFVHLKKRLLSSALLIVQFFLYLTVITYFLDNEIWISKFR